MKNILLADDDKVFLESIKLAFEDMLENVEVLLAYDGMDALIKFDEHRPELVITDYDMPHRTGIDLVKGLRKNGHSTPVILVTGNIESIDVTLFSEVIEKPFRIEQLIDAAKKYLTIDI